MVQVLARGGMDAANIDPIFITEVETYVQCKGKLEDWARTIISFEWCDDDDRIPILKAIIKLNDVELIKDAFFANCLCNSETFELLVRQCDAYGWSPLSTAMLKMFRCFSKADAIVRWDILIGNGNFKEGKKEVCLDALQVILRKTGRIYEASYHGQMSHKSSSK